jgi:RNA-binding protein
MAPLSKKEIRQLKARAQTLKAAFKLGKQGVSPEFVQAVSEALKHQDLLKVRLEEERDAKHEVAASLAAQTQSALVTVIGHVAVLYRPLPAQALGEGA